MAALPAATHAYALQQLYVDQDRDWVIDPIPAVLTWISGTSNAEPARPFSFLVDHKVGGGPTRLVRIDLTWTLADLRAQDATVAERADRMCTGKTAQREHVTELAAYGLTFVAMSVLMPGTRIKHMRKGLAPDILFDVTPGALRGVEAAGRATGGRAARCSPSGTAVRRRRRWWRRRARRHSSWREAGFRGGAPFALVRRARESQYMEQVKP